MTASSNSAAGTSPVPIRPAPWSTRAETYWLMLYMPATLPANIYDPLEASSPSFSSESTTGKFRGGLGIISIVRYSDTPCGAYNELMIIPGAYDVPSSSSSPASTQTSSGKPIPPRNRIARIYVDGTDTTFNGRTAWNIPKHLARFSFSAPVVAPGSAPPHSLHVAVYPPHESATTPFFSATLTPFRWLPATSFDTKWLPLNMDFVQPPIPAASATSRGKGGSEAAMGREEVQAEKVEVVAGTEKWRMFGTGARTRSARGCWVEVHGANGEEEEKERGLWWPQRGVQPWKVGGWFENAEIDITAPTEWRL